MARLLAIWRSQSTNRRLAVAGVLTLALAGTAVAAYEVFKRPADVINEDVDFVVSDEPEAKPPKDETTDWPTYGFDDARTRYFPTTVVRPPFESSDWSYQNGKLLEFSPIVVDDVVYFQDIETRVQARRADNGKQIWAKTVGKLAASAPAYKDGKLFVTSLEPGQAVALDAKSGKVRWKRPLPGRSESSPVTYRDELVIFGCECGTVFALSQKTGAIKWTVETSGEVKGALALGDGKAYGGNYAGEAFAIDADTGEERWRTSTSGGSFGRGGGIYSTPAVAFGRVYFGSIDSRVYSLDQDTGEIAWSKSTGAEVYPGPALADGPGTPPSVYIGSADDNFYALDARTGAVRWQRDTGGDVTGAASVIGDVVYVSVIGEGVGTIGYRLGDAEPVFEHKIGEYNPAITDGKRLFLTGYSELRAFQHKDPKAKGKQGRTPKRKRKGGAQAKGE